MEQPDPKAVEMSKDKQPEVEKNTDYQVSTGRCPRCQSPLYEASTSDDSQFPVPPQPGEGVQPLRLKSILICGNDYCDYEKPKIPHTEIIEKEINNKE